MRYVLIVLGYLPEYIRYTINTIISVDKDAEILICSDKKVEFKHTTFINLLIYQTYSRIEWTLDI